MNVVPWDPFDFDISVLGLGAAEASLRTVLNAQTVRDLYYAIAMGNATPAQLQSLPTGVKQAAANCCSRFHTLLAGARFAGQPSWGADFLARWTARLVSTQTNQAILKP